MATKRGTGRDRLIDAAWALWGENGPDGTTITEICDRAGVSQATFFYHFSSVPEVIAERVKVMSHLDEFRDRLIVEDLSTTRAIEDLVSGALSQLIALGGPIVSELIGSMASTPALFERFNDENLLVRSTLTLVYERAKARGELAPDVDPGRMATSAVALALLTLIEWAHGHIADDQLYGEVMARLGLLHRGTLVTG